MTCRHLFLAPVCAAAAAVLVFAVPRPAAAQSAARLAWDEAAAIPVSGYAVSIDGVRTDYQLTPVISGVCCSIPLPVSGGRHTIVVTAYNSAGESPSAPVAVGPVAAPGGPYSGRVSSPMTVSAASSSTPGGTIVSYAWTWGDGTSQTTASPATSHVYGAAGVYTIALTVTDNAGATATATTTASATTSGSPDIVLWMANTPLANVHGSWRRLGDPSAAGGFAMWNVDASTAKVSPARAAPASYVEQTFHASANVPYHLWVRLRAQADSAANDSVHVQFSDAVDGSGVPIARIGTSGSEEVVLQNGPTASPGHGWGWADNGWGAIGSDISFASTGTHTLRIQQREDGAIVDEVVLSPATYLTTPPGTRRDDTRLLANTEGTTPPSQTVVIRAGAIAASSRHGNWQVIADPAAAGGSALLNPDAGAGKIAPALANPTTYFETTFAAAAGVPYHVWVRLRAVNDSLSNDSVHVQFSDARTAAGTSYAAIGTTASMEFVLQDGASGTADHGWGWTDNGWGAVGDPVYFATSGTHTIRVQQREDGAIVDQIVISPDWYFEASPGTRQDDTAILPASR